MKAPYLLIVIVLLHVMVVGSVLFIQGCGTARQNAPEPPPAPVMPPSSSGAETAGPRPDPVVVPPAPERDAPRPSVDIKTYTVQPGDMLSRIANKVGVSARELSELNGIDNPDMIRVGQELVLPAYAEEVQSGTAAPAPPPRQETSAAVEPGEIYEVAAGDVLSRIAVRHGTTVKAIMQLNNLSGSKILVGQKLRMPKGATAPAAETEAPAPEGEQESIFDTNELDMEIMEEETAPADEQSDAAEEVELEEDLPAAAEEDNGDGLFSVDGTYTYTVSEGDTQLQIAKDFAVDLNELRKINNLSEGEEVKPGQEILIPLADL